MRALITGASGFLGKSVVEAFESRGHSVRPLVRSGNGFIADLEGETDLVPAYGEVEVLVHLATTLKGTERLLDAMRRSKTHRIIFISSFSVYDFHALKGELTEDSPLETNLQERDAYAQLKFEQERLVQEESIKHGWDLTILRPAMLWKGKERYPSVLAIPVGKLHFVIGPHRPVNLMHVKNCAKAIVEAAEANNVKGETINLVDPATMSAWKFMGNFLDEGIRIPIPYWLGYGFVKAIYPISRYIPRLPSIFYPRRFEARFKNFSCSDKKFKSMLIK